jgi:hypothetical protein
MARGRNLHRPRGIALALTAFLAAASLVLMGAHGAGAGTTPAAKSAGRGQTVDVTINLPALVLDNLCNGDVVNLSGDLRIRTTTTPTRNGGYTVRSSAIARDLQGNRILPPPAIGYHGDDGENAYSYYAPPPYPSTHRVVHWTRLVPEAKAPSMYLVLVLQETIMADGTVVPVFERAYLVCKKPSCSSKHIKSGH